jgi:hypothetical protein
MDEDTMESLRRVIDYLWKDEFKSWQESGKPNGHILDDLIILDDYLNDQD